MKKQKPTGNEIMNWWLVPYHGTTIEEIFEKHPEYAEDNRKFYQDYSVTEKQHDEWYDLTIERLSKAYRWSKERTLRQFSMPYLNLAPSLKK